MRQSLCPPEFCELDIMSNTSSFLFVAEDEVSESDRRFCGTFGVIDFEINTGNVRITAVEVTIRGVIEAECQGG